MELILAVVILAALIVSWFVLPGSVEKVVVSDASVPAPVVSQVS